MTNVDQFESVFRSAAKEPFRYEPVDVSSVLVVTDLEEYEANRFGESVRRFLRVLPAEPETRWTIVPGDRYRTVPELLAIVEAERPSLVCTYRNLHGIGWRSPFTLGDHVAALTQATPTPVLVLPHPEGPRGLAHTGRNTDCVMAMTDHLAGEDRLVNFAARFTEPDGKLLLTHVEDEAAFERTMDAISKIDELDTGVARERIRAQLLKEPADYIESCRTALADAGVAVRVEAIIAMGHALREYRSLVEEHEADLLVINTKDDDQLAMHGIAHPLAVELRQVPLLML